MALDRLLDLHAQRFLCFSSISFCFSHSYAPQTKLASSLVNFRAHSKIVLIDWLIWSTGWDIVRVSPQLHRSESGGIVIGQKTKPRRHGGIRRVVTMWKSENSYAKLFAERAFRQVYNSTHNSVKHMQVSASEMTYIVSRGALNSTHSSLRRYTVATQYTSNMAALTIVVRITSLSPHVQAHLVSRSSGVRGE